MDWIISSHRGRGRRERRVPWAVALLVRPWWAPIHPQSEVLSARRPNNDGVDWLPAGFYTKDTAVRGRVDSVSASGTGVS